MQHATDKRIIFFNKTPFDVMWCVVCFSHFLSLHYGWEKNLIFFSSFCIVSFYFCEIFSLNGFLINLYLKQIRQTIFKLQSDFIISITSPTRIAVWKRMCVCDRRVWIDVFTDLQFYLSLLFFLSLPSSQSRGVNLAQRHNFRFKIRSAILLLHVKWFSVCATIAKLV